LPLESTAAAAAASELSLSATDESTLPDLEQVLFFFFMLYQYEWLAVWLSGNALASINVVALRQTRLVPRWVTVCGRVDHLGM